MFIQLTCARCGRSFFVGKHRKIIVSICDDCLKIEESLIEESHKDKIKSKWEILKDVLKKSLKMKK